MKNIFDGFEYNFLIKSTLLDCTFNYTVVPFTRKNIRTT